MHTQQGTQWVQDSTPQVLDTPETGPAGRTFGETLNGIRQATALAASALIGCGLLIGLGTALSLCGTVHPLLPLVAGLPLTGMTLWAAWKLLWRSGPTE